MARNQLYLLFPNDLRFYLRNEFLEDGHDIGTKTARHAEEHDVVADFEVALVDPGPDIHDALAALEFFDCRFEPRLVV